MSPKEMNWEAFQKHLKYTDEELATFKADPKRSAAAKRMFSPGDTGQVFDHRGGGVPRL